MYKLLHLHYYYFQIIIIIRLNGDPFDIIINFFL